MWIWGKLARTQPSHLAASHTSGSLLLRTPDSYSPSQPEGETMLWGSNCNSLCLWSDCSHSKGPGPEAARRVRARQNLKENRFGIKSLSKPSFLGLLGGSMGRWLPESKQKTLL